MLYLFKTHRTELYARYHCYSHCNKPRTINLRKTKLLVQGHLASVYQKEDLVIEFAPVFSDSVKVVSAVPGPWKHAEWPFFFPCVLTPGSSFMTTWCPLADSQRQLRTAAAMAPRRSHLLENSVLIFIKKKNSCFSFQGWIFQSWCIILRVVELTCLRCEDDDVLPVGMKALRKKARPSGCHLLFSLLRLLRKKWRSINREA